MHNDGVWHTAVQWAVFTHTIRIAVVHSNTKANLKNCGADEKRARTVLDGGDKLLGRMS